MLTPIRNSTLNARPPMNVKSVLLKPCIKAAVEANAHKDQNTPGITIKNESAADIGSRINWNNFNKINTASTIVIHINASMNLPFPLNNLPPTVIITENNIIWKTWFAVK